MTGSAARPVPGPVGVLEVGGTHLTAALVTLSAGQWTPGQARRVVLDAAAPAEELLKEFAAAITTIDAPPDVPWAVAIPGPFDYSSGVGLFEDVGKFDSLLNVDVGSRLRTELPHLAGGITFLNDADAFAIGEWRQGVTAGAERCVGITLGTGVGSAFLDHGLPVIDQPTVPPDGRVHYLHIGSAALEDVVSRRAILTRYLSGPSVAGCVGLDLQDIFDRGRQGDDWARRVLDEALHALGVALAPWLERFKATVVAVGGGMTGSWDLVRPPFCEGLRVGSVSKHLEVPRSADSERSSLVGAASSAGSAPT